MLDRPSIASSADKPKLLVVELWGLGDLVIATPFLQAASERYSVTLMAKPYAKDLQIRFWPKITVVPFTAPWTAFKRKYLLFSWPWRQIFGLRRRLMQESFDFGLSARWDPRDHLLLSLFKPRQRLGFARMKSHFLLTQPLTRPEPIAHRYENWRVLARALNLELPSRQKLVFRTASGSEVLVHTGAGQVVRVWPLNRYRSLVAKLRQTGYRVQVACDPDQQDWWRAAGEANVATPQTVSELMALIDNSGVFIGNDSGPGHLAAFCGLATFTLFGPQLAEWFAPLNPGSEWLEGKACPFKPCSDYCRFSVPHCLTNVTEEEVFSRVALFLARRFPPGR